MIFNGVSTTLLNASHEIRKYTNLFNNSTKCSNTIKQRVFIFLRYNLNVVIEVRRFCCRRVLYESSLFFVVLVFDACLIFTRKIAHLIVEKSI